MRKFLFALSLLSTLLSVNFSASAEGNTDLLAHWKLDETSGNIATDMSGNSHTGSVSNIATWTAGKLSGALSVDGTSDISVANNAQLQPESLTLSAWVNVDSTLDDWGWIAGEGDNFGLFVDRSYNQNNLYFYYYNGLTWVNINASNTALADGRWHHVAASFDKASGSSKLYIDTQQVASGELGGSIVYSRREGFHIASMDGARKFKGSIDDVRLYGSALSQSGIAAISTDNGTGTGKTNQTITFNPPRTKIVSDAPFSISASATSGLDVSFSSTTPAVCSVSTNTVTIVAAGSCSINASQAGNESYNPATDVIRTISIREADDNGNTDLLAHWKLDETSGSSAADASGNGHTGSVNNTVTWASGKLSGALSVAGTSDISVATNSQLQPESLTLSAWVKVDPALDDWGWIAGEGDNYGMFVNRSYNQNSLYFYYYNGLTWLNIDASNTTLADGQWHHVAASFDKASGSSKLYIDTQQVASGELGGSIVYTRRESFHIASMDGARKFKGSIDDVRLYNAALSQTDIAAASTDGSTGGEKTDQNITLSDLPEEVAYWPGDSDTPNFYLVNATSNSGLPVTLTKGAGCGQGHNSSQNSLEFKVTQPGTCVITATQEGNDSYNPAPQISKTMLITKYNLPFSITAPASKTLDDAPFGVSATPPANLGGWNINDFESLTPAVCSMSGNTVTILAVGDCTIRAFINNNLVEGSQTKTIVISEGEIVKEDQNISLSDLPNEVAYWPGDSDTPNFYLVNATSSSELPVTLTKGAGCGQGHNSSQNSLEFKVTQPGTCVITATQEGNDSYNPAPQISKTMLITKYNLPFSITAPASKTLDDAPFGVSATPPANLGGWNINDFESLTPTVCSMSGNTVTILAVGDCTIRAFINSNLVEGSQTKTIVISEGEIVKQDQSIIFEVPSFKNENDEPFTISATATSDLPVSFTSITPEVCSITGNTVTIVNTGLCQITMSQAGNDNFYPASDVTPLITIVEVPKEDQTISFNPPANKTEGDEPFSIIATATSGLTVSFASTTPSVCSLSVDSVTIVSAGNCSITASQAGNNDFNSAVDVERTIVIEPVDDTSTPQISGSIRQLNGVPINNATVEIFKQDGADIPPISTTTDAAGHFSLDLPYNSIATVRVSTEGFTTQIKTINALDTNNAIADIVMVENGTFTNFSHQDDFTATGRLGTSVSVTANSFENSNEDDNIGVILTPLNASNNTDALPGSYTAILDNENEATPLYVLGATEFTFVNTRTNQEVNLKSNESAIITIPLFNLSKPDGTPVTEGESISLFSLNESTGVWEQEGEATVIESASSPSGFAAQATVSHFSWWSTGFSLPPSSNQLGFANISISPILGAVGSAILRARTDADVSYQPVISSFNVNENISVTFPGWPHTETCFWAILTSDTGNSFETPEVCVAGTTEVGETYSIILGDSSIDPALQTLELEGLNRLLHAVVGETAPSTTFSPTTIESQVTYTISSGSLPPGVNLNTTSTTTAIISGNPSITTAATYSAEITAIDDEGNTVILSVNYEIINPTTAPFFSAGRCPHTFTPDTFSGFDNAENFCNGFTGSIRLDVTGVSSLSLDLKSLNVGAPAVTWEFANPYFHAPISHTFEFQVETSSGIQVGSFIDQGFSLSNDGILTVTPPSNVLSHDLIIRASNASGSSLLNVFLLYNQDSHRYDLFFN